MKATSITSQNRVLTLQAVAWSRRGVRYRLPGRTAILLPLKREVPDAP